MQAERRCAFRGEGGGLKGYMLKGVVLKGECSEGVCWLYVPEQEKYRFTPAAEGERWRCQNQSALPQKAT